MPQTNILIFLNLFYLISLLNDKVPTEEQLNQRKEDDAKVKKADQQQLADCIAMSLGTVFSTYLVLGSCLR
jgi:aspartate ammonia-lyase